MPTACSNADSAPTRSPAAMARAGARMVSVAKSRSRHTMPQDEINALLEERGAERSRRRKDRERVPRGRARAAAGRRQRGEREGGEDEDTEDAYGNGLDQFGAEWYAVTATGDTAEGTSSSAGGSRRSCATTTRSAIAVAILAQR